MNQKSPYDEIFAAFQQAAGKLNVNLPPMGGQPGDIAAAFTQNLGGGTLPPGGGRGGVPFTQPLEPATQGPAPYVDPNVRQPIVSLGGDPEIPAHLKSGRRGFRGPPAPPTNPAAVDPLYRHMSSQTQSGQGVYDYGGPVYTGREPTQPPPGTGKDALMEAGWVQGRPVSAEQEEASRWITRDGERFKASEPQHYRDGLYKTTPFMPQPGASARPLPQATPRYEGEVERHFDGRVVYKGTNIDAAPLAPAPLTGVQEAERALAELEEKRSERRKALPPGPLAGVKPSIDTGAETRRGVAQRFTEAQRAVDANRASYPVPRSGTPDIDRIDLSKLPPTSHITGGGVLPIDPNARKLGSIRDEGLSPTIEEAKTFMEAGLPVPKVLSDREEAEKLSAPRDLPGDNIDRALVRRVVAQNAHRVRSDTRSTPDQFSDKLPEKIGTLARAGRFDMAAQGIHWDGGDYDKFLSNAADHPMVAGDVKPTYKRNFHVAQAANHLRKIRAAWPEDNHEHGTVRRDAYVKFLSEYSWPADYNAVNGNISQDPDVRVGNLITVVESLIETGNLGGPGIDYQNKASNNDKDIAQELRDIVNQKPVEQGWGEYIGNLGSGIIDAAKTAITAPGQGVIETAFDTEVELQRDLPWAKQGHELDEDNKIRADDPRVLTKILTQERPREGVRAFAEHEDRYEDWVKLMVEDHKKGEGNTRSLADMYIQVKLEHGDGHAELFHKSMQRLHRDGRLGAIIPAPDDALDQIDKIASGKDAGLRFSLERPEVGEITPIKTIRQTVRPSVGGTIVDGKLVPDPDAVGEVDSLLREQQKQRQAGGVVDPVEEGLNQPGYEGMFATGDLAGEPEKYDFDPDTGEARALFLGHADPDDPTKFVRKGEKGYDPSLARPALKPGALDALDIADAETRVKLERQEAERKRGIAQQQQNQVQQVTNDIATNTQRGLDLYKGEKTGQDIATQTLNAANKLTNELATNEIDAMVKHLTKEENLLIFAKQMTEGFVKMGDSMTNLAMGVRPGEKPTYIPTSVYEAINSVGKDRESALMRLSIGTMTGHWFPPGTSADSMKAQMSLLTHTQNLKQKDRMWQEQLRQGDMKNMLDYRSKMIGFKVDAEKERWMREYKNRLFAHDRERDAYNYSLERAKLQQEDLGNIKLDRLELDTINALRTTLDMGKEVLAEKSMHGTGWFKNWWQSLGNYGGWADPAWHAFKQKTTFQLNTYVNNLTGKQLSKHEVARLKGVVPQMIDDDPVFLAKAKTFIKITQMMLNRQLRTYALNGHDVSPFLGDQDLHYRIKGGGERKSSYTDFRTWIGRNPHMLGRLQLLTGPQGQPVQRKESQLGEIMGNFIIVDQATGKLRYNEEKHGPVSPGPIIRAAAAGLPTGHGAGRVAQRMLTDFVVPGA